MAKEGDVCGGKHGQRGICEAGLKCVGHDGHTLVLDWNDMAWNSSEGICVIKGILTTMGLYQHINETPRNPYINMSTTYKFLSPVLTYFGYLSGFYYD